MRDPAAPAQQAPHPPRRTSRLFTLALNQALIRRLASPPSNSNYFSARFSSSIARASVMLYYAPPKSAENTGTTPPSLGVASANLALVPLLLSLPLTVIAAVGYTACAPTDIKFSLDSGDGYDVRVGCVVGAGFSVIELKTAVRVRAKGLGVGAKSLMTFLILFYDSRLSTKPPGYFALFAFAGGQMAYSIVLFVTDAYSYPDTLSRFRLMKNAPVAQEKALCRNSVGAYFDLPLLKLSMILNEQFVLKHILTEGDKVVLSCYSPMAEQGGYALAANYGDISNPRFLVLAGARFCSAA
ncbi:Oligosaccharide translocation protein rft1 [Pleurotus ostreatus]|nr:Oligosaccharide translocation protein rft1 [Pleurotus ostreatus]KAJ8694525.1 Oligosaccharide translocation protein rft1 [Pleurotus ostreatus]